MTEPLPEPSRRKYGLLVIVFLLLALGGITIWMAKDNAGIRFLGVLACLASVYCGRMYQMQIRAGATIHSAQRVRPRGTGPFGGVIGITSILLVPLLGLSVVLLYLDVAHGSHQLWPLYLLFCIVILCALCWSYLAARWVYYKWRS